MEEASGNYWYMTSPLYMVADKKLGLDWAVKIFIAHTSTPMPGAVSVSLTEHIMIKGEKLKPSDVISHEGHLTVQQTRWLQTYLSRFNLVWPSSVTGDEGIHSPMSQEKGKKKKKEEFYKETPYHALKLFLIWGTIPEWNKIHISKINLF